MMGYYIRLLPWVHRNDYPEPELLEMMIDNLPVPFDCNDGKPYWNELSELVERDPEGTLYAGPLTLPKLKRLQC
jgi:hypothetical protein